MKIKPCMDFHYLYPA